ncbi:MAG: cytochrome P450 [Granulicella sp.]
MTTPPIFELEPDTTPSRDTKYRLPPGLPHSLPFYAFKKWVKLGDPIRLFEHLHKVYGNIAHYRFMGTPIVFLNDPDYIREVLVTQASSFVKERTVRRMKVLLGEGLITSDDPIHIRQRRIAAPAFHRQRIAAYAGQIVAIAAAQRDRWHSGQQIDIAAASMELSLEIVARTLFDTEVTADIRAINDEVNTVMGLYNFLVAFPRLEWFMRLPIPGILKFKRSKAHLDAVVNRLVHERRAEINAGAPDKGDLLSMLLTSTDERADEQGRHTGMSDDQIRDEVLTIFLAGYETVANALTWTWYLLSQHPDIEARLHAELDSVLDGRLATLADYPNLRYTEQVFAESMRLYPPAWAMGRMSTKPVTLGPYTLPPGSHVFFSQYIMGRTPEYFPDPLRFDPDRFTPEAKAARAKYTYFPFGGGSRQCIGESFAWMEGTLALATIAQRWRPRFVPAFPIVLQPKITLRPKNPVMMRLEARQD